MMQNEQPSLELTPFARRTLLQRTGFGMGAFALSQMLQGETQANATELAATHFPPKAKSVIYIHLVGAASHLDLYDFKPELQKQSGKDCPKELFESGKFAFVRNLPKLLGTPAENKYAFRHC